MRINPNKCVACGNCTYVCPMDAIYVDPVTRRSTINRDECVECTAGGAPRRGYAPKARAASRRRGRLQHPGDACAEPDRHRAAERVTTTERVASAVARSPRFDAALKASPALPGSRIATAGEWRVFV